MPNTLLTDDLTALGLMAVVTAETFASAKASAFSGNPGISRIMIADRGNSDWRKWGAPMATLTADQENYSWFQDASGGRWYLASEPLNPEMFGAVADYNYTSRTGTVNTLALQAMLNFSRLFGKLIFVKAGRKYLTGALYANYDATFNPVGLGMRPGRIAIQGMASGIATGALEDQGAAFIHIDGEAKPLFTMSGTFSPTGPDTMGGHLAFNRINFVGGSASTDVIFLKGANGQMSMTDMTVKGINRAGNGVTVSTTWEKTTTNLLVRGPGHGLGPNEAGYNASLLATGIGWNETDDSSGGQINMSVYTNMNCYKWGYNIRIGRTGASTGTFGPIVFIGGQSALADYDAFTVGGGVLSLTTIGYQIEQSRLNGLKIDSAGTSDIPRVIRWLNGYFTNCGKIEDGTVNSFAINVVDGEGVEIDSPVFQNLRSGITFDRSKAKGLKIRRPYLRSVSTYGAASGTLIDAYGALTANMQITLEGGQISSASPPATVITANASLVFPRQSVDLPASVVAPALTGATAETTLATIPVPAGMLGVDGIIDVEFVASALANNANAKTMRVKLGGATFQQVALTSVLGGVFRATIQNRGTPASQIAGPAANAGAGTNSSAPVTLTINTATAQNITITGQLADGTDTISLDRFSVTARVKPTVTA